MSTLAERQARENVRELQEMATSKSEELRELRYRIDDLAMALQMILKRVTLQTITANQNEDFVKTMVRIDRALRRDRASRGRQ